MELFMTVFILITAFVLGIDSNGRGAPEKAPATQSPGVEEVATKAPVIDVTVCSSTQRRIVERNLTSDATDQ